MIKPKIQRTTQFPSQQSMDLLSRLLLSKRAVDASLISSESGLEREIRVISREQFDELVVLASSNHVVVRGLRVFRGMMLEANDQSRAEWAHTSLSIEEARISTALLILQDICRVFESENHDVAVIKSLDHWPDLGSDLDLYTDAHSGDIVQLMSRRFDAKIAARSWGDRLAGKWNFMIPGLPEAVEVHMGRLGQTGEQTTIASRLMEHTRRVAINRMTFRVTSASDRLMISTLQRMYRHFYFRLCDVLDTAELSESGGIDYEELRSLASGAGIWEGVATYLVIVSDYVRKYRGEGLDLPTFVISEAHFGGDTVYYGKEFLRVPIMPQSARLYGLQLAGLLRKGDLRSGARLSILPWLATAAAVGQKLTGSDKGIW